MKKHKRKSGQEQFRQTMIIAVALGASMVVIATIYMMKLFGTEKIGAEVLEKPSQGISNKLGADKSKSKVATGVIKSINNRNIEIWTMEEEKSTKMLFKPNTEIKDIHGKVMSKKEIQKGDIVEVTYKTKDKEMILLQESTKAWEKIGVSGIEINSEEQTIKFKKTKYNYNEEIFITNMESSQIDISEISQSDTFNIRGIGDQILSMQLLETGGYLKLTNIPESQGMLEIGNNKIYQIAGIENDIPLSIGEHKIVIHMDGYHPFVEHINITENEIYTLNLNKLEEIIANLRIRVVNTDTEYTVKLNNKSYKNDEIIEVKPGKHSLKVMAEGFKTLEHKIDVKEGDQTLNINLEEEEEEEKDEKEETKGGSKPSSKPNKNSKPNTNNGQVNQNNNEKPKEEIKTVQIIIETDPSEAQVFVSGVYKGTTPTLTGLKPGEYSITIEKEGYTTLYSTIIIDASNEQKGFLYTLEEE